MRQQEPGDGAIGEQPPHAGEQTPHALLDGSGDGFAGRSAVGREQKQRHRKQGEPGRGEDAGCPDGLLGLGGQAEGGRIR